MTDNPDKNLENEIQKHLGEIRVAIKTTEELASSLQRDIANVVPPELKDIPAQKVVSDHSADQARNVDDIGIARAVQVTLSLPSFPEMHTYVQHIDRRFKFYPLDFDVCVIDVGKYLSIDQVAQKAQDELKVSREYTLVDCQVVNKLGIVRLTMQSIKHKKGVVLTIQSRDDSSVTALIEPLIAKSSPSQSVKTSRRMLEQDRLRKKGTKKLI